MIYTLPGEIPPIEYHGLSHFIEDSDGYHIWWVAGKVDDAHSVRLDFVYNPWFNAWQVKINYGRTINLFKDLPILKDLK